MFTKQFFSQELEGFVKRYAKRHGCQIPYVEVAMDGGKSFFLSDVIAEDGKEPIAFEAYPEVGGMEEPPQWVFLPYDQITRVQIYAHRPRHAPKREVLGFRPQGTS